MLVQQANTVLLVLYGTYLIHHQNPASRICMGALIACVILSGRALAPLSQVAGLMVRLQQARVALGGIDNIVERKTERDPARSYLSLSEVQGALGLEGAGYRYGEQGPLVLQGLNLTIAPGEKVAILGRIGSGKTTLLRLLAGLYTPSAGNVLLDGMDMRQIDPADLRAHVSLLGQAPRLFMGSLRENLELGRMDRLSNDAELIAALKRFGLDKLVQAHPLGLNLPIGEDGHGLSGGQKQVVGLARLTLRDPRVVLLDEPTSGLDEMRERMALQAVSDWAKDRTLVVVTHRLQVLPFVQRIIVLDQGRVVMDGPRDAVLAHLRGVPTAPGVAGQPAPAVPSAETTAPAAGGVAAARAPQVRVIRISSATPQQGGPASAATPQGGAGVA
ncbi:MAG TPA: ATP-binding cassette domain-containing protein [Ottowia sp.]|nr:ATP-binding cassette domain-containing protein [Ottowia sp.]